MNSPESVKGAARTTWISDPEQLQALVSPMRQNLMDRLEAIGPATVADLAEHLDVAQDALYYHVRKLESVGLLRRVDMRRGAGRDAVVYDLAARNWHIRYRPGDPDNEDCLAAITAGMLRQTQRDFERGFSNPEVCVEGETRSLWSLRLEASLGDAELKAVNRHLEAILGILRKPRRGHGGKSYALTWVLAPLTQRRTTPP